MAFFDSIRNIFRIEELRGRIIFTLALLAVYRVGSYIVLPGIDPVALEIAVGASKQKEGILGLLDLFSGSAFFRASVFALGVMPYISTSIIVQLLGTALPYFQKLQREGEEGRRKLNQMTRVGTVIVTLAQASAYVTNLKAIEQGSSVEVIRTAPGLFWLTTTVILTAGTIFVMWLGEKITDKGIGNGISVIIMIGIIARLPIALVNEFNSRLSENGLIVYLIEIVALALTILMVILLTQGTRRIPVQYAKRIIGNKMYGGTRQFIPLRVNAAGVMPIIFAQSIMFIPATIAQFFPKSEGMNWFAFVFLNHTAVAYNIIFALLIIIFTYFYTAIVINPVQMADDMKRNGGFIPGVKPGKKTSEFIDHILTRITLPGSIFLAFVAIFPAFASSMGVSGEFSSFFGGTSLLILVGVILDTLQQIESYLLMRHYDGLMKSGRIKGRYAASMA